MLPRKNPKLALISDIHFGCKSNNEKQLEIISTFFLTTLLKVLDEQNITDVRILGDLFDNRNNINVRTLNEVLKVFQWYADNRAAITFTIIKGNHDIYYHNRTDISSLESLRHFKNVNLLDKVVEETIAGKTVVSFPWLCTDSESELLFKDCKNKKEGYYDLCLGHFEINGFEVSPGQVYENGEKLEAFKAFKKVFTGHFHLRNTMKNVSYLGCPYQLTWGDYGDIKGIHVYDVSTATTEFIPNTDSPMYVKVDMKDFINKNVDVIKKIAGNNVRLVINEKYSEAVILKIISLIESKSPLKLDVENNYYEADGEIVIADDKYLSLTSPIAFINEYIKTAEVDDSVDKTEAMAYITSVFNSI